jgi:hypothetical protein
VSALSDHNFLEQYYKREFDTAFNQETFVYVKQQEGNAAWTVLGEPRIRNWVSETMWLPRADGFLIGQSFFDIFTYNGWASAGYGLLRPAETPAEPLPGPPSPPPFTTVRIDSTRLDLTQELSAPFYLGAIRMAPYGVLDLTYYSQDLTGEERGRFYGGGGVRASVPWTRLYPTIQSELFNVNGINHKVVWAGNYYVVHSDTMFSQLPQLDRLDDDATDQARRDITPMQPFLNPKYGLFLQNSPYFNPQTYAIRRLVESRIDTRDTIEVVQADFKHRWQTKRGFPGMQHIVDYATLDLSGSFFPHPDRDNFGSSAAFLEYDYVWNIGDRTALVSSGWYDPIEHGVRMYTFGAHFNRPDRTNFFLGYRQIDPLQSRAVTASVSYVFSPKYAATGSATYDFGTGQNITNALSLTRMGADFQLTLGLSYNAMQQDFGVIFQIVPNLLPQAGRVPGMTLVGQQPNYLGGNR